MHNMDGVVGDARKRLESGWPVDRLPTPQEHTAQLLAAAHPQCRFCARLYEHTHITGPLLAQWASADPT